MSFVVGENIGPYRLTQQLGQGGMATVFKAFHPRLNRDVAIKVLHIVFMDDPNFLKRFEREAQVVAKLEHPNIVPIYDYAEHEGRPYLVIKFIEGETLKQRLDNQPIKVDEILQITEAISSALDYAHDQDVLHRDIKPSNVLLSKEGGVYLVDFGLARMAQSGESSLTADRLIGTPQYISPEQAVGKPDLDRRTDIYSLGITVYEMLTGRAPYNADTPFAIIHDHIYSPLPMPRSINPQISEKVEQVVLKALAKDPNDRYGTAGEFARAFRNAVLEGNQPVGAVTAANLPPTLDLQAQAHGTDTAVPAAIIGTPATGAPPKPDTIETAIPIKAAKKMPKKLVIIGIVIGALVFLAVCVTISISIIRNTGYKRLLAQPSPAVRTSIPPAQQIIPGTPEAIQPVPDNNAAQISINNALTAWKQNDMDLARKALQNFRRQAGVNPDLYREVVTRLNNENAYLLSATLLFDTQGNNDKLPDLSGNPQEVTGKVHEIVYHTAMDPLSDGFFTRNSRLPFMLVASIRHDFFYGDTNTAKQRLDQLLNTPPDLKRFPEAHLLEVEFLINNNDPQVKQKMDVLLSDNTIPSWIHEEAQNIYTKKKP